MLLITDIFNPLKFGLQKDEIVSSLFSPGWFWYEVFVCCIHCRPLDDKADDQTRDFPKLTCVRYAVCSGPRQFNAYLKGKNKPCSVLYCFDYSAQVIHFFSLYRN